MVSLRPCPQQQQPSLLQMQTIHPALELPSSCAHLSNPGDPNSSAVQKVLDIALFFVFLF